uniref:phosphoenolpyruvate carboxylase n=1 Tax=Flavobacterium sp. TaxID=239 RepID=UPI00404B2AF6
MYALPRLDRFNEQVRDKYQIYHNVFMTLPFDNIGNTGALLPLFAELCESGFAHSKSPTEIIDLFFTQYFPNANEEEQVSILFRYIQYIERQVVLFDAIEDAAFPIVNNMEGTNSIRALKDKADNKDLQNSVKDFLNHFQIRPVLTAHPTQFYPGSVLGIITDLTDAIRNDDLKVIKKLLAQLGKTPFIKKEKPTPFDEAVSLIWYLENVFYEVVGSITEYLQKHIIKSDDFMNPIIKLGFWPGGDRDGNPFVNTEITLSVAQRLRTSILKCYYFEIRNLKRKLTFTGVDVIINQLEQKLYRSVFYSDGEIYITQTEFESSLDDIKKQVIEKHQGLYLEEINLLRYKIATFGFYFASLDIRQNSRIHAHVFKNILEHKNDLLPNDYESLSENEKLKQLSQIKSTIVSADFQDEITRATLSSIEAMKTIQERNGASGCNRYIISNNESALHVMETYAMFRLLGWENPTVDIVPLFESVDDLHRADLVMQQLYENQLYKEHLAMRNNTQTIMLGFSDGTKDGGYLMANWAIYKAKETISQMSNQYGIKVLFFDGRGGPPARGGGKTQKFYASLGSKIQSEQIQITVQGQTISSNFGTIDSCRYNLENLISAGATNRVYKINENDLSETQRAIIDQLSNLSYEKYLAFKNHPKFLPYLEQMSTLPYYAKTNIGSRPAKRNAGNQINFADLRAIPFVGSWSQLKQNVPGFFGVGTALQYFEQNGQWEDVANLFKDSLFFRTLLENSMMSICKSFFPLTSYMKNDTEFGEFWSIIYDEFILTERLLLKISGENALMQENPDGKASIEIREKIVRPLLAIQQYALSEIRKMRSENKIDEKRLLVLEKLVTRSLFGNINASRNSA